jgi:cytochrome P450
MSVFESLLGVEESQHEHFIRQFDEDPYPFYKALRDMGPVVLDPVVGMYHVTGRDEIEAVLKDWQLFSSRANEPLLGRIFGPNLVQLDGAEHMRQRGLLSVAFTPSAVAKFADTLIVPELDFILGGMRGAKRIEFVGEFCFRYPLGVIGRWIGVQPGDHEKFTAWYKRIVDALRDYPLTPEARVVDGQEAVRQFRTYLRPLVREKMDAPPSGAGKAGNLLGELARAEVEGERLTEEEMVSFAVTLLFAGAETTQRLLGTLLFGILSTGVRDAVRKDEKLMESAVEEALRWNPPAQSVVRTTTAATKLGGVEIPKGALVSIDFAAHQRDPAYYPDPDTFRADRRPTHYAFSAGRHTCLGAPLARLEAKIGVARFLEEFPTVRLDPAHEVHFRGIGVRSPVAVHLLAD